MMVHTNKDVRKFADDAHDEVHQNCDPKVKETTWGHNNGGHHHSHNVPGSVASVAWMVIVGDGFHNFADGLAIGSAFANSLTGGLSTSIAVFCHELPHELGDFAMLLNAGMSAKQALIYNCVSSVLCLLGMVVGVVVGNVAAASSWIFALIAGLFLYVALVDMLPEMTSMNPKKGEHPLFHLVLQNSGMLLGVSVMLIIALFERQLQDSFTSSEANLHHLVTSLSTLTTATPSLVLLISLLALWQNFHGLWL
jgi:zinc transporter ZupT